MNKNYGSRGAAPICLQIIHACMFKLHDEISHILKLIGLLVSTTWSYHDLYNSGKPFLVSNGTILSGTYG